MIHPEPYSENGTESFNVELKTPTAPERPSFLDPPRQSVSEGMPDLPFEPQVAVPEPKATAPAFNLSGLPPEEQELHRRANRVAKVSMQDIKMLRPNDVRLGREQHDLCWRLRDDLEKAHREYDRRFQTIMVHPVDYFYDWLVEILADGNAEALGEYPYPSPVLAARKLEIHAAKREPPDKIAERDFSNARCKPNSPRKVFSAGSARVRIAASIFVRDALQCWANTRANALTTTKPQAPTT